MFLLHPKPSIPFLPFWIAAACALGTGHAFMKDNIVDVQQIKQRLAFVTDKVLGPDHKVHEVLLQVVQQRRM